MHEKHNLLRAVHFAARRLSSSGAFDELLREALQTCIDAAGASGGSIYFHDKQNKRLLFRHVLPEEVARNFPFTDIPDDFGVAGSVFHTIKA